MTCARIPGGIVCFQPDYHAKDSRGKLWRFEFHRFMGPSVLKKNGDIMKVQPGERSHFWPVLKAWLDGGQRTRVDEDGVRWAITDPVLTFEAPLI